MTATVEQKIDLKIAQRALRELADRLDSAANIAGHACVLSGSTKDFDGIDQNMNLALKRAEGILHDLEQCLLRCKAVRCWSSAFK